MPAWILPLLLLISFEALADILAKAWSLQRAIWLAIAALTAYLLGNVFWLLALRNGSGLARGAVIFSVAAAIMAILIGFVIYGEKIRLLEGIGIVLGLISIIFLVWE